MRSKGEGTIARRTITRADGSSYKRFQAAITAGRLPSGQPNRVFGPLRKTQDEAKADLQALKAQRKAGIHPDRQTLAAYLQAWMRTKEPHLKQRTVATYRSDIDHHIVPALGGLPLQALTPAHINAFLQGLKPSAARKCRAVLHAAMHDALRQERVARNPVAVTQAPKAPRANLTRWTPENAHAFARACVDHSEGAVFLTILATGLRAGEALGLMWHDLDGDVLTVRRQLLTVGRPRFDTPKTLRSIRKLRLGADLVTLLARHRTRLARAGILAERDYPGAPDADGAQRAYRGALMFPHPSGEPRRLDTLRPIFRELIDAAGVPRVRIHDLRHYHLSRLVALGMDPATVSRRAGHSRTSTTMDIYVEAFEDQLARSVVTLGAIVGEDEEAGNHGEGLEEGAA